MAAVKKKILIVDDEEDFGRMVKLNLENTGSFEVAVESFGSRALAAAKAFGPDLIILDIMMRDMAGPAVERQISADTALKNTPVIFLSAAVPRGPKAAETFSGRPYLAKPPTTSDLIAIIEKYLKK